MKTSAIARCALILVFLTTGCAGMRGGYESRPIGNNPEIGILRWMKFPGLDISAKPYNSVQSYDSIWFMAIPVRYEATPPHKGIYPFTLHLSFRPSDTAFHFEPSKISLSIGETNFPLSAIAQKMPVNTSGGPPPTIYSFANSSTNTIYSFILTFDIVSPRPDTEFSLNLSRALTHPRHPPLPPIRFGKKKWKKWYS